MSEEQRNAFIEASKPLIKYLNEYHHPHTTVIVTSTTAECMEWLVHTGKILDFIKD